MKELSFSTYMAALIREQLFKQGVFFDLWNSHVITQNKLIPIKSLVIYGTFAYLKKMRKPENWSKDFEEIALLPNLKSLSLYSLQASDSLKNFPILPNVTELFLELNIQNPFKGVENFPNLEILVSNCKTLKTLNALKGHSCLSEIHLYSLNPIELTPLLSLPKLRDVFIEHSSGSYVWYRKIETLSSFIDKVHQKLFKVKIK